MKANNRNKRQRHYRINPETLQLERIEHGIRYWLRRSGGYIIGGICIGILFFYIFLHLNYPLLLLFSR